MVRVIVGEETEVVVVAVVPRKQEHALETREAGKDVTPVGNRSSSSVRPPGYTERVIVEVDVVITGAGDAPAMGTVTVTVGWKKMRLGQRLLASAD